MSCKRSFSLHTVHSLMPEPGPRGLGSGTVAVSLEVFGW